MYGVAVPATVEYVESLDVREHILLNGIRTLCPWGCQRITPLCIPPASFELRV
jgi:hypothetical protein